MNRLSCLLWEPAGTIVWFADGPEWGRITATNDLAITTVIAGQTAGTAQSVWKTGPLLGEGAGATHLLLASDHATWIFLVERKQIAHD